MWLNASGRRDGKPSCPPGNTRKDLSGLPRRLLLRNSSVIFRKHPPPGWPYMPDLEKLLSRLRPRGNVARRVATSELIDAIGRLSGADQILLFLDSAIKETFRASSVAVSLLEPITGRFVERSAKPPGGHPPPSLDFTPSDRLAGWLALNQVPAVLSGEQDLRGFLTPGERDRLSSRGICLVVPMYAADRLVGLLHLGPRSDGSEYSPIGPAGPLRDSAPGRFISQQCLRA